MPSTCVPVRAHVLNSNAFVCFTVLTLIPRYTQNLDCGIQFAFNFMPLCPCTMYTLQIVNGVKHMEITLKIPYSFVEAAHFICKLAGF